ncbi:MAG: hypothetical protein H6Q14_143 [Bacteroidetes bacterium]|nr:hypothetical protein [Bacteroidota bacterium]
MKSIVVKDNYGLDNLTIQEQTKPVITENEILVQVKSVSLNYLDVLIAKGGFGNHQFPHILGYDASGIVKEIGSKVSNFKVGDLVCTHYTQTWQNGEITLNDMQNRLGTDVQGVFSEYIALPESSLIKIPCNLTFKEASTLPIAALTAWEALVNVGQLKAGQTVLLQGTGGVSIFALQFAKALGAKVFITSSSDEKLQKAKELGADLVLNYRTNNHWQDNVMTETKGIGVDLALEMTGASLNETLGYLKINGKVVIVGFLDGSKVDLDVFEILYRNASIVGIKVGSKSSFAEMNRAIEVNNIRPFIDKEFNLSDFREAFNYVEQGKHFGKIIINF